MLIKNLLKMEGTNQQKFYFWIQGYLAIVYVYQKEGTPD